MEIDRICRTCLSKSTEMRSVFTEDESFGETRLFEMLMTCATVQVSEGDGLPSQVCLQCVHHITKAYSFKQLCERSDSTLRQLTVVKSEPCLEELELCNILQKVDAEVANQDQLVTKPEPLFEVIEPFCNDIVINNDHHKVDETDIALVLSPSSPHYNEDIKDEWETEEEDESNQPIFPQEEYDHYFTTKSVLKSHVKLKLNCKPNKTMPEPQCTQPENASSKLLSSNSKRIYEKQYKKFCDWCSQNAVTEISEDNVITYFELMGATKKSSTVWTAYSMLRTMLNIEKKLDISKFEKLISLLKRQSEGYEPKKSKIFEFADILRFIDEAPDHKYLGAKVILIIGYSGACTRQELVNITVDDIVFKEDSIRVAVTKANLIRIFVIVTEQWKILIERYANMRPANVAHRSFFLTYKNGRCRIHAMGVNKMGIVPRAIAAFLKLPNPEQFSGNCFRRSSNSHRKAS